MLPHLTDAPGNPQGPLTCKDMMGDSCTLSWRAPDDNGGSDITNYVVERRPNGTQK